MYAPPSVRQRPPTGAMSTGTPKPDEHTRLLPSVSPARSAGTSGHGREEAVLGAPRENSEERRGDTLGLVLVLVGIAVMLLIVWVKVFSVGYGTLKAFTFHPTFNVLAICTMALGIVTLQPTKNPRTKVAGLARHQKIMLGIAVPSLILGTGAIIKFKISKGSQHFKSLHAQLALFAIVWLIIQVVLGAGSVWFNGRLFSTDKERAKRVWKWHRASGYALFFLFQAVIWTGAEYTHFFHANASHATRIVAFTVAPVLILAGTYIRARLSKMPLF